MAIRIINALTSNKICESPVIYKLHKYNNIIAHLQIHRSLKTKETQQQKQKL